MHADGIRPVRGARAEHSAQRPGQIIARVYPQDVAIGAVQPRQQQQLVADSNVAQGVLHGCIEDELGQWRTLLALLRRLLRIAKRRLNGTNDA